MPRRAVVRAALLALAAALVAPLVTTASAGHCATWSTTEPDIDTNPLGLPGPRHYVDYVWVEAIDWYSIWWYEESNGIPGLQHENEVVDDTCHGMIRGDAIVF